MWGMKKLLMPACLAVLALCGCTGDREQTGAGPGADRVQVAAEQTRVLDARDYDRLVRSVEAVAKALPEEEAKAFREALTLIGAEVKGGIERTREAINPLEMAHAFYKVCVREKNPDLLARLEGRTARQVIQDAGPLREQVLGQ